MTYDTTRLNVDVNIRILLSSIMLNIKEICKNVNYCHSSYYFFVQENTVFFFFLKCAFLLTMGLVLLFLNELRNKYVITITSNVKCKLI